MMLNGKQYELKKVADVDVEVEIIPVVMWLMPMTLAFAVLCLTIWLKIVSNSRNRHSRTPRCLESKQRAKFIPVG